MADFLLLRHGSARLTLVPQLGGAIHSFEWRSHHILRPAPAAADDPFEMACLPMAPYVNHIPHGRFEFGGLDAPGEHLAIEIRLAPGER